MFNYSQVPAYMHEEIRRYVEERIKPERFLLAVLANNFMEAVGQADDNNIKYLKLWAQLIHWELPSGCHGSPEKVKKWLREEG